VLAVLAVVLALAAFAIPFAGLSLGESAGVIAALLIVAEVLAAIALVALGRDLYDKLLALRDSLKESDEEPRA
jgi:hypothetical protein